MKFYKLTANKETLGHVPEDERYFFLQMLILLNDININLHFAKYIIVNNEEGEVQKGFKLNQTVYNLLSLLGKIKEGNEVLRPLFFKKEFSRDFINSLDDELKDVLETIKQNFNKFSWIHEIRKKFSFHYDPDETKDIYKNLDLDDEISIFLSTDRNVNCFSTNFTLRGILRKIDQDKSYQETIKIINTETIQIASLFVKFILAYINYFLDKYSEVFPPLKEIELDEGSNIENLAIPTFINDLNNHLLHNKES